MASAIICTVSQSSFIANHPDKTTRFSADDFSPLVESVYENYDLLSGE